MYTSTGYQSVITANREGRVSGVQSGESHYLYHRPRMVAESRNFRRNNGIYSGMIERMCAYIVGNGFGLQIKGGSKTERARRELLWKEFWKRPEIKNMLSGKRVERMVCSEILTAGDTGAIKTTQGKLQLIESEQIVHSTYTDGISKSVYGTPKQFFAAPYGNGGGIQTASAKPYTPDQFLFVANPDRPSSFRGVPPCQASFPMLHRINDVCDSEAIAWQMLARMAISITREGGPEQGYAESVEDGNATDDELATRMTEMDYALIFHGQPGEKVEGIARNIPGSNFSESLLMFLRLLGLPLGLPLEIILLDWTKSNYSQSRAVLEQAYQTFLSWQNLIEDFFLTPVLEWKIKQWQDEGKIAKTTTLQHEWIKPTFPWIDQLKEAQAYGAKVDRGFATHGQVCKSLNAERDDIVNTRVIEVKDAIERAQKIEEDTGVIVPWQIFAGLDASKVPNETKPMDNDNENKPDDN